MIGRYALYEAFASGGMATVHLGRDMGAGGRTVAIKRLHAQFVNDPEFVTMLLDEARLAACVRHPNVVSMLDIVTLGHEPFLVMEYVQGESLSRLIRGTRERGMLIPGRVVGSVMTGALHGLHAAHEARNEHDELLGLIHRDVSPHNVLVGVDGYARMVDFGVAKAAGREQHTRAGQLKGKLSYMAPEQARFDVVNRQTDVYAAAVVMWEALTGQRLFYGETDGAILARVIEGRVEPPSQIVRMTQPNVDRATFFEIAALDPVVMCGLALDPARRFGSAYDMAVAIERSLRLASPVEVSGWVTTVASDQMQIRAQRVIELEGGGVDVDMNGGDRDSELGLAPAGVRSGEYLVQRTLAMQSPVQASAQFLQTLQMPPQGPVPLGHTMPLATGSAPRMPEAAPSRPLPPQSNFDVRTGLTPSQLSSISVSTPSGVMPAPKPPRSWGLIGAMAAIGAFVLAAAVLVGMGAVRRHQARLAEAPPATSTTTTQAPLPPAPAAADPAPTTVATPVVTTTATTTATPTATATPTVTPKPKPPRRPPTPAPLSDECKPPYTIDADGVRHYKAACL